MRLPSRAGEHPRTRLEERPTDLTRVLRDTRGLRAFLTKCADARPTEPFPIDTTSLEGQQNIREAYVVFKKIEAVRPKLLLNIKREAVFGFEPSAATKVMKRLEEEAAKDFSSVDRFLDMLNGDPDGDAFRKLELKSSMAARLARHSVEARFRHNPAGLREIEEQLSEVIKAGWFSKGKIAAARTFLASKYGIDLGANPKDEAGRLIIGIREQIRTLGTAETTKRELEGAKERAYGPTSAIEGIMVEVQASALKRHVRGLKVSTGTPARRGKRAVPGALEDLKPKAKTDLLLGLEKMHLRGWGDAVDRFKASNPALGSELELVSDSLELNISDGVDQVIRAYKTYRRSLSANERDNAIALADNIIERIKSVTQLPLNSEKGLLHWSRALTRLEELTEMEVNTDLRLEYNVACERITKVLAKYV